MSRGVDDFGDRMKDFEGREAKRTLMPTLPIIARIDGRTFSKFTKPFDKPFDSRLANAMRETTRKLVEQSHARIGYTQSDEITLIFQDRGYGTQVFFGGRVQKLASVLAGMATAYFIRSLDAEIGEWGQPGKAGTYEPDNPVHQLFGTSLPHFDCRVWNVPNEVEAANTLLWRAMDAQKNGISAACRTMYSPKEMDRKSQADMLEMMNQKGIDYHSSYSVQDRYGTFMQRRTYTTLLDDETWDKIPDDQKEKHGRLVTRSRVVDIEIERFKDVENRVDVIFDCVNPVLDSNIID